MEILGPNFIPLVFKVSLYITAISLMMLIVVTGVHWRADQRQSEILAFDQAFKPALESYLDGETSEIDVIETARGDPEEALNVLMHLSIDLPPASRPRLQPLFGDLIKVDEEIEALQSMNVRRRLLASERLGYLKNENATHALVDILDDEIPAIRLSAARSLAAQGRIESIEPILRALDLPSELNELREVEAIFDFGPCAVPALIDVLESPPGKYSSNAIIVVARVLGMLKSQQATPLIIQLLSNKDVSVRINAAHALGDLGDPGAVSDLAALVNDPSWEVRSKAMKSLGKLHAEQEMATLSRSLTDQSWWVRFSGAQALYSLGEAGVKELQLVMVKSDDINAQEMCREVLEEHNILDTKKEES